MAHVIAAIRRFLNRDRNFPEPYISAIDAAATEKMRRLAE